MFDDRLRQEIARVAARFRARRFWWLAACIWLIAAMAALAGRQLVAGPEQTRTFVLATAGAGIAAMLLAMIWMIVGRGPTPKRIAKRIESEFPDLRSMLLTAVEMEPELPEGRYGFLQAEVIHRTLRHARTHAWRQAVSRSSMAFAYMSALVAAGTACAAFAMTLLYPTQPIARTPSGATPTLVEHAFSFTVEPGNTEVERGNTLLVLARVRGPMPLEAELVYRPADPAKEEEVVRQSMQASLNDPVFGARISQVQEDLVYYVELGGTRSPEYRASVFEYPRLERADAMIHYPAYAAMEDRLVQDVRTISAPEGSNVELICILNKEVTSAMLQAKGEPPIALAKVEGEAPQYIIALPTDQSRRWKLELTDAQGRTNQQQVEFSLTILPNKPASIKPIFPARDLEVSPLEEIEVKATASDDYGVKRFGLTYSFALNEPVEVVLGEDLPAKEKHERSHLLALESLGAKPDELLSYYFWTEDIDATGTVRRNMGDMYFAEVRPFEEIFRQGQQPPGGESQQRDQQQQQQQQGGGQNAQRAQQLAELQKEIIGATWKVIRRETGATRTTQFANDVQLVQESQDSALEQATSLGEQLQDVQSQAHLVEVLTAMQEASKQLQSARESGEVAPLQTALASEQKAYQSLLRLRAREHEVIRAQQSRQQQQQRNQSRSSQSRSEQQLQQLDLSNEENRYEQQRTAPQEMQESPEQREDRQVLNRLKELARRQHDLNERLKELQNALEEAKTEEQKEEVRRQLKRLQEEQQEILRDTDELQSRMENEQNLERMSQEREQLQQARENTRRASEALEEGRVSQSAAAGARAEQSFDELKEEFRRRASGQFNERMRDLREQARALDENQKALGEKLAEETRKATESRSLREEDGRDALLQELMQQRGRLEQLQEQMKQTITDAEETEPLLSEKLYDAVKDLNEQKPDRALQSSSLSLRSGLLEDAKSQERVAAEGIRQLRESVEKAAEAVLGDETEALRRAREELNRLADELERDLARNAPEEAAELERGGGQRGERGGEAGNRQDGAGEGAPSQRDQDLAEQLRRGAAGEGGERSPGEEGEDRPDSGQRGERQQQEGEPRERTQGGQDGQPREGEPRRGEREGGREGQDGEQRPGQGEGQGEGERQEQQEGQTGQAQTGQAQAGQAQAGRGQAGQRQEGQQQERSGSGRPGAERPEGEPQEGERQAGQEGREGEPQEGEPGQQGGRGGRQGQRREGAPRQGNASERDGEPQEGEPRDGEAREGERNSREPREERGERRPGQQQLGQQRGGDNRNGGNLGGFFEPNRTGGERGLSPITGEDFRDWADRLRDVEEMVDDPELRAEAARIRERARSMRAEARRHSKEPNFKLWRVDVAEPLKILRDRVAEELLRKSAKRAITPIDRDPTPPGYSEKTRRYYEQLGKGE